jgi:Bacterial type II/III secretion system short domain
MNGVYLANKFSVRRSSCVACLLGLLLLPAVAAYAQEASEDASEAAAEAGKRAERLLEAQQREQETQRRQSNMSERERTRARSELEAVVEGHKREASRQRAEFEAQRRAYSDLTTELKRTLAEIGPRESSDEALKRAQQQLEVANAKLREMVAQRSAPKPAPLPEDAELRVFALKNSKASDLTRVLANIVGDRAMRMAVDEQTNSLIVTADKNSMSIVEALLLRLDQSGDQQAANAPAQTLQLRIMWLVDNVEGTAPTDNLVGPQVLDALHQLGLSEPQLVCQQVTTLTLGDDKRRGQFEFAVPVVINGRMWQLGGDGLITRSANDRFAMEFELAFVRTDGSKDTNQRRSQLRGSIYSPLGHYTVMGTSTLVDFEDGPDAKPYQHLSAFVVYLDRAPDFPASKPAEAPPRR